MLPYFNRKAKKLIAIRDVSYILDSSGWIPSFWESIGLEEFVRDDFERLGR